MTRYVLLATLCLGAGVARADMGMLPGGASVKYNKLLLHEHNSEELNQPETDPDSKHHYFNQAHCVCSFFNYTPDTADPTFFEKEFAYELTIASYTTAINRPIEVWTGTSCDNTNTTQRDAQCHKITVTPNISQVAASNGTIVSIPVYDLMFPESAREGCDEREQDGTTWAMVDADSDGVLEYSVTDIIHIDTKPPPLPINFKAVGAEGAVEISWEPPPEGVTDIAYYQALCASTLSGASGTTSPKEPRYFTPRRLCGAQQDAGLTPSAIESEGGVDAGSGSITLPQELAQLDPGYICGETTSNTATSMRISGLENGIDYTVVFVAIDLYGNARGTYFTSSLRPQPATDFWEDLKGQGSGVEGGFCLISQTFGDDNPLTNTLRSFRDKTLADSAYGRWLIDVYYGTIGAIDLHGSWALRILAGILLAPLVVFALLWHLLTLPGLLAIGAIVVIARRRRKLFLRLAPALALVAPLLLPLRAHAQAPYWDAPITSNESEELPPGDPGRVNWHAGVRLGPYTPQIDAQLNMPSGDFAGPYEQMFGGWTLLPMVDVERFFLKRFGQLGAGITLGYMGKKAHAWQSGSDPNDPNRPRAAGDENSFRLIPIQLNAIYRLSYLDDEWGVPLVPYAKIGVAYYVWWVTAPNGDFAQACSDGSMSDGCQMTTAAGASLGIVGSVGLAIRAERVDAAAARSMRDSGIEHAGFYGEYSIGKVDGFGSAKKLSVGDATWFAGIDFEF